MIKLGRQQQQRQLQLQQQEQGLVLKGGFRACLPLLLLLLLLLQLHAACCWVLRHTDASDSSAAQTPGSSSSSGRPSDGSRAPAATAALGPLAAARTAAAAAREGGLPVPVVLLLGPPCSGKGTLCQKLQQQLPVAHVSSGDELRRLTRAAAAKAAAAAAAETGAAAAADTAAAADELPAEMVDAVARKMREGQLVNDELVAQLLQHRLRAAATEPVQQKQQQREQQQMPELLLLDGFPRTAAQVSLLRDMGAWPVAVLLLSAPASCLVNRVSQRIIDPETGAVYGPQNPPPPALLEALRRAHQGVPPGGAPEQGSPQKKLGMREDDSPEILMKRIETYEANLAGILKALQTGGGAPQEGSEAPFPPPMIFEVDAGRHIDLVVADADDALRELMQRLREEKETAA
ncbi:hypothetical protein Efla_000111 [Eimeria flavescens]